MKHVFFCHCLGCDINVSWIFVAVYDCLILAVPEKSKGHSFWQQVASVVDPSGGAPEWTRAFEDVEGDPLMAAVLNALRGSGVPAPECCCDIAGPDGDMVCSPWMKWESERICAIGEDDDVPEGWTVLKISASMSVEEIVILIRGAFNNG